MTLISQQQEEFQQQPIPLEGERYDVTPLELNHVMDAFHNIWVRAISFVWNKNINSLPWGVDKDGNWVQITSPDQDIEPKYSTFEDFLIAKPVSALSQLGFESPDVWMRATHPNALPPLKILRYSDLQKDASTQQNSTKVNNDDVKYQPELGTNGWFSDDPSSPCLIMPQLTLIIPPAPEKESDQGMALVDYQMAALSYPFTACASGVTPLPDK